MTPERSDLNLQTAAAPLSPLPVHPVCAVAIRTWVIAFLPNYEKNFTISKNWQKVISRQELQKIGSYEAERLRFLVAHAPRNDTPLQLSSRAPLSRVIPSAARDLHLGIQTGNGAIGQEIPRHFIPRDDSGGLPRFNIFEPPARCARSRTQSAQRKAQRLLFLALRANQNMPFFASLAFFAVQPFLTTRWRG